MSAPLPLKSIVLCGGGLAGELALTALAQALPETVSITYIMTPKADETDIAYGTVTPPSFAEFLERFGLAEPDILPNSKTTFSLGTLYSNWGNSQKTWMHSFHKSLPIWGGVDLHQYLSRLRMSGQDTGTLEDYIISVAAAKTGGFAHPPQKRNTPLADIDYGYHASPSDLCKLLAASQKPAQISRIESDVQSVERDGEVIQSILLSTGKDLKAEFYIDATGPARKLSGKSKIVWRGEREIKLTHSVSTTKVAEPYRTLTATESGWTSKTALRGETHQLSVSAGDAGDGTDLKLGYVDQPWRGNCLTIGHGAATLEPLTHGPIALLHRDVERLMELIPIHESMTVEAKEYNRRFKADYSHAEFFHRAFFGEAPFIQGKYWQDASAEPIPKQLSDKITQFKSRGVLVQYDYEPFEPKDWTQLHMGLGHLPERYDPLADRVPEAQVRGRLDQMRQAIKIMANKLPSHDTYMANFLKYLKDSRV